MALRYGVDPLKYYELPNETIWLLYQDTLNDNKQAEVDQFWQRQ